MLGRGAAQVQGQGTLALLLVWHLKVHAADDALNVSGPITEGISRVPVPEAVDVAT